ncbi:hypothetical protein CFD26_103984 [Aspergillus turcosus]|uniref:Uncharacterized protein n=1 Tax=Aspergillus turcosus TaxID=1245748 RepID=A0A3R7IGJ8_9EURO|nr:hypothetical protein CFD26_103984 [Aspergillus turcosus]
MAIILAWIPVSIRLHSTRLSPSELQEETKGWLQFEEWRPTSNVEDKVRQRRVLVEKWAAASQDFRDSYQLRAPSPSSALDYPAPALAQEPQPDRRFLCLAPADRQTNPRNYIRLIKFLILSTSTRHVYTSSGDIKASILRWPWNMGQVISFGQILGRSVPELAQSSIGGHEHYNQPYVMPVFPSSDCTDILVTSLDMDLPILDIPESAKQRGEFLFTGYGSCELWSRIIEQSAPGYLELEARGQELDFELTTLLPID